MVDHDGRLEEKLRGLKPRSLTPMARQRILDRMDRERSESRFSFVQKPVYATVAAALLLGITFWVFQFGSGPETRSDASLVTVEKLAREEDAGRAKVAKKSVAARVEPIEIDSILVNRRDEGIAVHNGKPVRVVRSEYVDRVGWQNAEDGKRYQVLRPRDEVVMASMRMY